MGSFWFWLVCFHIASPSSALLPGELHKFINAHFRNNCHGIDLYFCNIEDAVGHMKFRWLIFTNDNMLSVINILELSRLEMDSDVTLINSQNDSTLQFTRLSRMYFKTNFTLPANYSLEETMIDEKISQPIQWRGENVNFNNYSFDAIVIFLEGNFNKVEDIPNMLNKSVQPGVENIRRYFFVPVWYLMELYNFTLNMSNVKEWGVALPNGSLTGAFGMVERREVEFGFTAVRLDPDRIKHLDFSVHMILSRFIFVLVQPKTFGTAAALIVPFESSTWWAFILLVLVLIVSMRIIASTDKEQSHNDSWGGSMLMVFGGISQNGIPDSAFKISSRAVYLVTLLSLFMVSLYYSTGVLSGLIIPSPDPIQNVDQLIASDTGIGGQDEVYIRRELLKNDSTTKRARAKLISNPFLQMKAGLEKVKQGRFAFYGLEELLRIAIEGQFTAEERCLISELQMVRGFQLSHFWRKKSPFGEILNVGLLKMRERGVMNYLEQYWLVQKPKCSAELLFAPIKVPGMTLAYAVLAVGVVISLMVAIFELLSARRWQTLPLQFTN
ncbi:hypothetical protein GE061_010964 [Apolygus lucorum]|uniref:Ionotropic glutamate receptor C-terminal domain-containing protein n=1 Tax=Apolygus lucorum TaxID=248454 RepID=A0A8S9XYS1_APOLU|nr:hypothetical protein GE061_010964 [Apolygus lucorum]